MITVTKIKDKWHIFMQAFDAFSLTLRSIVKATNFKVKGRRQHPTDISLTLGSKV